MIPGVLGQFGNQRQQPARLLDRAEPVFRLTWTTFVHTVLDVDIDWDPKKAEANFREHGIAFAEAATVLTDDFALTREDLDAFGEP